MCVWEYREYFLNKTEKMGEEDEERGMVRRKRGQLITSAAAARFIPLSSRAASPLHLIQSVSFSRRQHKNRRHLLSLSTFCFPHQWKNKTRPVVLAVVIKLH